MNHLDERELVELLEGGLDDARRSHAETCAECESNLNALKLTIAAVQRDAVPEPSPLFWEHLSRRVGKALDNEPLPADPWLRWLPRGPFAPVTFAVTLVALMTLAAFAGWSWRGATAPAPVRKADAAAAAPLSDTVLEFEDDGTWDVIAAAAAALEFEAVREVGITARPGSAERVALALSDDERTELGRLIEDELKQSGS